MSRDQERTIKNFFLHSNVFMIIVFWLFFGAFCSLVSFSMGLFILFIFICVVELAIAWSWWKKGMESVRFNTIINFIAILNIGFYAVMPLIEFAFGSIIFLVVSAIYLAVLGFTIVKKHLIADGILNLKDSKIGIGAMIAIVVIMIIGGFGASRVGQERFFLSQLSDFQHKIYAFSVMYLIGLWLTFISPVIFKHKEAKAEAENPLRRKTSRAQRRREAKKKRNFSKHEK